MAGCRTFASLHSDVILLDMRADVLCSYCDCDSDDVDAKGDEPLKSASVPRDELARRDDSDGRDDPLVGGGG